MVKFNKKVKDLLKNDTEKLKKLEAYIQKGFKVYSKASESTSSEFAHIASIKKEVFSELLEIIED